MDIADLPSLMDLMLTYSIDILQLAFVFAVGFLFIEKNKRAPFGGKRGNHGKGVAHKLQDEDTCATGYSRTSRSATLPMVSDLLRRIRYRVNGSVSVGTQPKAATHADGAANVPVNRRASPPRRAQKHEPRSDTDQIIAGHLAKLSQASRIGDLRKAEQCFAQLREIGHPDRTETFNQMIAAAARKGNTYAAELWFDRLQSSECQAGVITYDTLMDCHAKLGDLTGAETWYRRMVANGVDPRRITFQILINAAGKAKDPSAAHKWFQNMTAADFSPDMITFTTLIDAATRQSASTGEFNLATISDYYAQMKRAGIQPDVVVFTTLITAAAKAGEAGVAERWFTEMEAQGVAPNIAAYTAIIMAHVRVGNMASAEERCYQVVRSTNIPVDEQLFAVMLDGYAKAGNAAKLEEWFARMVARNIHPTKVSYAHVLSCYVNAQPCDTQQVINTLRRMAAEGVQPGGSRCLNLAKQALGDSVFRPLCIELGFNPNHCRWSRSDREKAREREQLLRSGARRNWVEVYGNPKRAREDCQVRA